MTISLYDTAARQTREFVPLRPGQVSIYLCGATVQAPPHIGHIRSGVAFDVMSRWFAHRGYDVTLVRNVTDIDDKIIAGASQRASRSGRWRCATSARSAPRTTCSAACRRPASRARPATSPR